jgi:hypothetical protein
MLGQDDVSGRQLSRELSVSPVFVRLDIGNGSVMMDIGDDATQVDVDELLSIAAAHFPGSLDVKLYRYLTDYSADKLDPPYGIDFVTGLSVGLFRNVEYLDGDLPAQVIYYASASSDENFVVTYSDPVVQEDYVYVRDEFDVVREKRMTISWFLENGNLHATTKEVISFFEG